MHKMLGFIYWDFFIYGKSERTKALARALFGWDLAGKDIKTGNSPRNQASPKLILKRRRSGEMIVSKGKHLTSISFLNKKTS